MWDLLCGEAGEDGVLDLLVHLLCELLHFIKLPIIWTAAADQRDNVVENGIELSILQHLFSVALGDVEDGVAGSDLHFRILVWLQTVHDGQDHGVEELNYGLVQHLVVLLHIR